MSPWGQPVDEFAITPALKTEVKGYLDGTRLSASVVRFYYERLLGAYRTSARVLWQNPSVDPDFLQRTMQFESPAKEGYFRASHILDIWDTFYHSTDPHATFLNGQDGPGYERRVGNFAVGNVYAQKVVNIARGLREQGESSPRAEILKKAVGLKVSKEIDESLMKDSRREVVRNFYTRERHYNHRVTELQANPPPTVPYPVLAIWRMQRYWSGDKLTSGFGALMPYTLKRAIELSSAADTTNNTDNENIVDTWMGIENEARVLQNAGIEVNDDTGRLHETAVFLEAAYTQELANQDTAIDTVYGFESMETTFGRPTWENLMSTSYWAQFLTKKMELQILSRLTYGINS